MICGADCCKNLFAYTENNPVNGKDSSGAVVETVWDVVSLGISIVDVCANPTDPWAWAGLVGDVADCLIPCVGGIGEVVKGVRVFKVARKADDLGTGLKAADNTRNAKKVVEGGTDVLEEIKRIDEIEVEFNYNSKYDETEFARQLADQQKGMNELTVQEYLDNRQKYIEQGRAIESNEAQELISQMTGKVGM